MDHRSAPAIIVERSRELAALDAFLRDAAAGTARVVLIEGVAGIGKTALLQTVRDRARAAGMLVLAARVPDPAVAAPYDTLRRLLGPHLQGRGELTGAAAFAAPLFTPGATLAPGVDYGCHWLLAALTDENPLLIAVDDAHWADPESLRVIADAAEDLRRARLAVVISARPQANPAAEPVLARLATLDGAHVLRPAPLTEAGVTTLLRHAFGKEPDVPFAAACTQATGGNVFYLRELVRPLISAGLPPAASTTPELGATGPEALARTIRRRLGELGPGAADLARAAAILGDDTPLAQVAALAGQPADDASSCAAVLWSSSILARTDPVAFPHPLIRAAVEQSIGAGRAGRLHERAATVLTAAGAPGAVVAGHLLRAPAAGSAAVVRTLTGEARRDLESGSARTAYRLLRRALAEPPAADARPGVLLALAAAERANGALGDARDHLREVVDTGERQEAVDAMSDLFEVLYELDDHDGTARLRQRAFAVRPYGPGPAEERLRSALLLQAATEPGIPVPDRLTDIDIGALPAGTGEQRRLLLCAAIHHRATGRCPPPEFVAHLHRVVADLPQRPLSYWEVLATLEAAAFLAAAEAMQPAETVLARLRPEVARLRGVAPGLQAEWSNRTVLNSSRCGRFEEALAGLADAEAFAARHGLTVYTALAAYARGIIALERGEYADAGRHLLRGPADVSFYGALGELLCGRPERALARLGLPGDPDAPVTEREIEFEAHLVASHAHELLGDRRRARTEAERELGIRRRHGPSYRLALALRRCSSFLPAREAAAMLAEATTVCAGTPRLPILTRVRASHGAALRRAGRLREARTELTAALDLAARLGMTRLAGRIAADLRAAGGRPRRTRITGLASLTAGQAAVARLAGAGHTNREIAEKLYITVKTVETHLAAVYRKLQVPGRDHLPAQI